ncbi:MAG: DUF2634 domain-containing protein [Eubacterium sp.]|nr:DUF2634 domain-containing protein [Eubacterium sp.]
MSGINSVLIPIPVTEIVQGREEPSKTYRLDFSGRILSCGSCDGLEAVNQFIKKTLLTPRFRCLIYDNQYGSEIKQTIIADDASEEYIRTDMPRIVKDALLCDTRILDVYDFAFSFSGREKAYIYFKVNTIFGTTVVEEVI